MLLPFLDLTVSGSFAKLNICEMVQLLTLIAMVQFFRIDITDRQLGQWKAVILMILCQLAEHFVRVSLIIFSLGSPSYLVFSMLDF